MYIFVFFATLSMHRVTDNCSNCKTLSKILWAQPLHKCFRYFMIDSEGVGWYSWRSHLLFGENVISMTVGEGKHFTSLSNCFPGGKISTKWLEHLEETINKAGPRKSYNSSYPTLYINDIRTINIQNMLNYN